jgi:hypothetical protein
MDHPRPIPGRAGEEGDLAQRRLVRRRGYAGANLLGENDVQPTPEQLTAMDGLVAQALEEAALGPLNSQKLVDLRT